MTSLIYFTNEDQAVIATDTLAINMEGRPSKFVDKTFILPRLRMIIAGTGTGHFADAWYLCVNVKLMATDIVELDRSTPAALRELWKQQFHRERTADLTTTVYHFGFDAAGAMRIYAYRSTTDFQSEEQPTGCTGRKPECTAPGDESVEFPSHFKVMMDEQRAIQARVPFADRVHIGGEINVTVLDRGGFSSFVLARFDDYDEMLEAILQQRAKSIPLRGG